MRLIITRHGETIENKKGMLLGQSTPGKLSEQGIEQAKRLAERLKDERIDAIYSSNLARAADTANAISKHHPDVPVKFVNELKEMNFGSMEGRLLTEMGFQNKDYQKVILNSKGESVEQLYSRAERFIHDILKKHPNETVLLVAHGAINLAIIAAATNKKPKDIAEMNIHGNTSVTIIEMDEGKIHKIHCLDCTKHLKT